MRRLQEPTGGDMAEHDVRHESVYAAAQLGSAMRRALVAARTITAVAVGLAVLLGLATPALASSGGPRTTARAAVATTATPNASGMISGHVTLNGGSDGRTHYVIARNGGFTRKVPISRHGDYTLYGLPAGSYRVTFDRVSGQSRYEAQFWNGHPESAGVQTADRVSLGAAGRVRGVNGNLRAGGVIAGTLVDTHQRPLADCTVQAFTNDQRLVTRAAVSAADGTFAVTGLTTGAYLVRVQHRAHDRNSDCDGGRGYVVARSGGALGDLAHARPVAARQGRTVTVGTQAYATAGRITGRATLPTGSTHHDHFVVARNVARPRFAVRASIHSDGSYALLGLVTGSYRVTFDRLSGQAFAEASFYRGHPESAGPPSHDPVDVTRGDTTTLRATSLRAGGSLTGRLADASGRPLDYCQVQAFTADDHLVTRTAFTGYDGSFTVGGLTTGRYLLRVLHGPRGSGCSAKGRQFYDGGSSLSPGGPDQPARPVKVQVGRATRLGRLTYALGASISGTVHFPGKRYRADEYVVARRGRHAVRARVGSDGRYLIPGLTAGSYRVTFDRISGTALYAPQFYDGHAEAETRASADRVVLAAGEQRTGVNATLKAGRHITGRIVDSRGEGVYCDVQAFTSDGSLVTRDGQSVFATNAEGAFDIPGLSAGRYHLRVLGNGYGSCNAGTQYLSTSGRLVVNGPGRLVDTATATTTSLGDLRYASRVSLVSAPTVTGTAQVGSTLTAAPGRWSPSSGLTFAYQWLSAGQPVAGATASTYSPTASDLGHRIGVEVTASEPGYVANSARSAPTSAVVAGRFVVQRAPRITGQASVGQVLMVGGASISPTPAATTYQWLRDGKLIAGATAATYRVVRADRGRALTVRVTYARPGYVDRPVLTKAVTVP